MTETRSQRLFDMMMRRRKHLIRAQGVAPGTFDREKAGISVRRERIGGRSA
jgi:hypothetical protein